MNLVTGLLIPFLGTTLGSAMVFLMKKLRGLSRQSPLFISVSNEPKSVLAHKRPCNCLGNLRNSQSVFLIIG